MTKFKRPWYLQTWLILLCAALSLLIVPLVIAIVLTILQSQYDKKNITEYRDVLEKNFEQQANQIIFQANQTASKTIYDANQQASEINQANASILKRKDESQTQLDTLLASVEKLEKREKTLNNKIPATKIAIKAVIDSVNYYREFGEYKEIDTISFDLIQTSVTLPIHSMDVKDLRKKVRVIRKEIDKTLTTYEKRYTTKGNKSIYSLMVIALQAELQNVLYNLKYDKIEKSRETIKDISSKYIAIAGDGNKSIYSTLVKFIGEMESLFLDLVDTEYEYYVKKEQAKEEQRALREQMRQEAEERKKLEQERKKIESEEKKFNNEISSVNDLLKNEEDTEKIKQLEERLKALESQLNQVEEKKENIVNLQNGKAGNVYIISNIGSFGEGVFKVGMTRRLEPMDRVKELGDASVPFAFDVHSFIFSQDAPTLEKQLHHILEEKRMNKVNLRKEFFKVTLDEIEAVVNDVEPTAEFKRTILAQEYRRTLQLEEEQDGDMAS